MWRKIVAASLLLLLSMALACFIVEGGLRLMLWHTLRRPEILGTYNLHVPHATRGWTLAPQATAHVVNAEYNLLVATNSRGLRDVEHAYDPPPNTFRIVVLGDSFMEARQIPLDGILPRLLDRELRDLNVEVINLGVEGYSPSQCYLSLQEEGLRYRPNLVIWMCFLGNDVFGSSYPLQTALLGPQHRMAYSRPYLLKCPPGAPPEFSAPDVARATEDRKIELAEMATHERQMSWLERSLACNVLDSYLARRKFLRAGRDMPHYDPNIYLGVFLNDYIADSYPQHQYAPMWNEAWQSTECILLAMRKRSEEKGVPFVLVLVPDKVQVEPHWLAKAQEAWPELRFDLDLPNRRVAKLCAENAISLCDLLPFFRAEEQAHPKSLYFEITDQHWKPAAHRLATQCLAAFLRREGLVPAAAQACEMPPAWEGGWPPTSAAHEVSSPSSTPHTHRPPMERFLNTEIVYNASFELWENGAPDEWRLSAPTDFNKVFDARDGYYAVELCTPTTGSYSLIEQRIRADSTVLGATLHASVLAKASKPGLLALYAGFKAGGKAVKAKAEHPGDDTWHKLEVAIPIPPDADPESLFIQIYRFNGATATAVIDLAHATITSP